MVAINNLTIQLFSDVNYIYLLIEPYTHIIIIFNVTTVIIIIKVTCNYTYNPQKFFSQYKRKT